MFIFGYFFLALAKTFGFIINIYILLIIADTVLSWLRMNNYNEYTRIVSNLAEPYLSIISKVIPRFSTLDFTPLIGIIILYFTNEFIINIFKRIGEILI